MTSQYEVMAVDECGHEIVLYQGTKEECQAYRDAAPEQHPECRQFSVQMNASVLAQERAQRMMDDEDFAYYDDQD